MKLHKIAGTIFAAAALAAAGASAQGSGAGSGASATPPGSVDSSTGTKSSASSEDANTSTDSSNTKAKHEKKRAKAQGRSGTSPRTSSKYGDVVEDKATTDAHGVPVRQNNPIDDQAKAGKLAGPMTDSNTDADAGTSTKNTDEANPKDNK
jgi:hypothetical protein